MISVDGIMRGCCDLIWGLIGFVTVRGKARTGPGKHKQFMLELRAHVRWVIFHATLGYLVVIMGGNWLIGLGGFRNCAKSKEFEL